MGVPSAPRADDAGASHINTCSVTVSNVAPVIGSLTAPIEPVDIADTVSVTGTFTDAGSLDTQTYEIDWDDGTTSSSTAPGGTVTDSHIYIQAGVYNISLTLMDDDAGSASLTLEQYVVVYDTQMGAEVFDDPTLPLRGGNIKIHNK